jgi:hypothetical protein
MAYHIKSQETGATYTFASREAYEAAEEWYNSADGVAIQDFCRAHGLDLHVSPTELRPDWHDAAMSLYARVHRQ